MSKTLTVGGKTYDLARGESIFEDILDSRGELVVEEDDANTDESEDPDPIEEKGIRRVRSAEGARRFGQPVGSVIKVDVNDVVVDTVYTERTSIPESLRKFPKNGFRNPHERAPMEGGFLDTYAGVRGWDWEQDGDPVVDWDSDRSRARLARLEAEELGVTVEGRGSIDYIETGLAGLRAYDVMFPGILYYVDRLSFERLRNGINGENRMHTIYPKDENGENNYALGYSGNTIIMSGAKWGTNTDDGYVESEALRHDAVDYYSTSMAGIAEYTGQELWRTAFLKTFNHEMGHTFARILFGHLRGENETDQQRMDRREYYYGRLYSIFSEFGMEFDDTQVRSGLEMVGSVDQNWGVFDPLSSKGLVKNEVREVLSEYGSKNIHEMMAEVWAEYITDPKPRAFAREVGDLLEEMMNEFLDQDGAR